jgi:hypothetical protein
MPRNSALMIGLAVVALFALGLSMRKVVSHEQQAEVGTVSHDHCDETYDDDQRKCRRR